MPCRHMGSGGLAHFLNVGIREGWVVQLHAPSIYPWGKSTGTHWIEGWVSPELVCKQWWREKKIPSVLLLGADHQCPAYSLLTILTDLPWVPINTIILCENTKHNAASSEIPDITASNSWIHRIIFFFSKGKWKCIICEILTLLIY